MKRYFHITAIIGLLFLILAECGAGVQGEEKTAEQFVEQQGYKVTSRMGEVHKYILDQSKLYGGTGTILYQQSWGVQTTEPDKYFGKEITLYGFTVSNHPLEQTYKAKTNVYVMLADGGVIGGYSFPDIEDLAGSVYSWDGKTLEEITGLTSKDWSENWKGKYAPDDAVK